MSQCCLVHEMKLSHCSSVFNFQLQKINPKKKQEEFSFQEKKNSKGMMLEALSSNDLLNFLLFETLSPPSFNANLNLPENNILVSHNAGEPPTPTVEISPPLVEKRHDLAVVASGGRGRKRRRRKLRVRKNKEEAESQRMTHIAVERNRRKQMNQHLVALRSLMPQSYAQKGDQASIVGGAIDFIKELEHHLQTLEAQKLQQQNLSSQKFTSSTIQESGESENPTPSLSQFFLHSYDQYNTTPIIPENKHGSRSSVRAAMADVDVTLIETHASIRILSRRSFRQRGRSAATTRLSKLVAALHSLSLSVLHLSVTTMDTSAIYSISTTVEESCQLSSVDDIAGAVHHLLSLIEEESIGCSLNPSIPEIPFGIS